MVVHKFQLKLTDEPQVFQMPVGAQVLTTQTQWDVICIWALVDPQAKLDPRTFIIRGTGHPVQDNVKYIGTVQQMDGRFVWHIFEVV